MTLSYTSPVEVQAHVNRLADGNGTTWHRDLDGLDQWHTAQGPGLSLDTLLAEFGTLHPLCLRCQETPAVNVCCTSHGKELCHRCYRRTHFVEVCVEGCTDCEREGLRTGAGFR